MKVYAQFDTIDDAENAARQLRQRCEGIRAVKIRYREVRDPAPDLPVSAFALFDSGRFSGTGTLPGVAFDSDERAPAAALPDGPDGRLDCTMEVLTDAFAAESVAHLLRSAHGRRVHILGAVEHP